MEKGHWDQYTVPKKWFDNINCKLRAKLTYCRQKNCWIAECKFPKRNILCVGAKVILLKNVVVEENVYNSTIGNLKFLHFEVKNGLLVNELKGYVIG
jgi:hypothetical protein